ncbi:MAG: cadherin-like beta sandwich domain-containing protein [Treponema sp.]|nr:cadherin-like beta sandwich domain-containing protein [Treponema sp.]
MKIISNSGGSQGEFIFTVTGTAVQPSAESRLSGLTFTKGKLDQQFHADIKSYTLKIDAAETIIRVTPAALNANITSLTVNGKTRNSGSASDIILASTDTIAIVVTAENGDVSSTYTITIQPVVNYSGVALSQFWISNMAGDAEEDIITFINSGGDNVWLSLPDSTQLKFKPVLVNSNATVKLNGAVIAHIPILTGTTSRRDRRQPPSRLRYYPKTERTSGLLRRCAVTWNPMGKGRDFPIGGSSGLSYYPAEHTAATHNNQFILINRNAVFGATWTKQTNPSWGVRQGHANVVYNNKVYVMGGSYNDGASECRDVWSSTDGVAWTRETASAEWTGRNDHTVNANSKGMWLVGGNDGYFKNDVCFSPDGKTWTKSLDAPFEERACHAAVVRGGYLYVFGGQNGSWEGPNCLIDIWRVYIGE